jgi:hypothetical protein
MLIATTSMSIPSPCFFSSSLNAALIVSHIVCAYLAVFNFSQVSSGQDVFASNIAQWGTALFSLSLATNIIVTSLVGENFTLFNVSVLPYLVLLQLVGYGGFPVNQKGI